jgi:hypothetical protein
LREIFSGNSFQLRLSFTDKTCEIRRAPFNARFPGFFFQRYTTLNDKRTLAAMQVRKAVNLKSVPSTNKSRLSGCRNKDYAQLKNQSFLASSRHPDSLNGNGTRSSPISSIQKRKT